MDTFGPSRSVCNAWQCLLFCQNLGRQLPTHQLCPCSAVKKKFKSLILIFSKQLDWTAKQEDGYFMNYINGLTMISYIYLGVKIKIQHRLNFDPFFDFYNCLGYFLFFIVYGVFVLYNEPIIKSLPTRAFLQITFADIVLMRLILKSHTFRDHILSMIRFNPRMFDLIS